MQFTVAEILDAIDKNGLKHLHGRWAQTDLEGKLVGGCALTQAAYNLLNGAYGTNLDASLIHAGIKAAIVPEEGASVGFPRGERVSLGSFIIDLNDTLKNAYPDNFLEEETEAAWEANEENWYSLPEITAFARKYYADQLDHVVTVQDPLRA